MARNGVPLAVAQKIMRHSDPKLTSAFYTHILVADKARELSKLPAVAATVPANEAAAKTGTTDTSRDTFALDSDAKTWSYMEGGKPENITLHTAQKMKNPLCRKEKEDIDNWWAMQGSNLRPPACKAGALTS